MALLILALGVCVPVCFYEKFEFECEEQYIVDCVVQAFKLSRC